MFKPDDGLEMGLPVAGDSDDGDEAVDVNCCFVLVDGGR